MTETGASLVGTQHGFLFLCTWDKNDHSQRDLCRGGQSPRQTNASMWLGIRIHGMDFKLNVILCLQQRPSLGQSLVSVLRLRTRFLIGLVRTSSRGLWSSEDITEPLYTSFIPSISRCSVFQGVRYQSLFGISLKAFQSESEPNERSLSMVPFIKRFLPFHILSYTWNQCLFDFLLFVAFFAGSHIVTPVSS